MANSAVAKIQSLMEDHPRAAVGGLAVAGIGAAFLAYKNIAHPKPGQTKTAVNPLNGTLNLPGNQPGVLGFVGWAPYPESSPPPPTTSGGGSTPPPSGSGGTPPPVPPPHNGFTPPGALKTTRSADGSVVYGLFQGTASDPNAYYINGFNASGQVISTTNRGCVGKDTTELCVGFGNADAPGTGQSSVPYGTGGPYAARKRDNNIQPYAGVGGQTPYDVLGKPRYHQVQEGETRDFLARKFYGMPAKSVFGDKTFSVGDWLKVY